MTNYITDGKKLLNVEYDVVIYKLMVIYLAMYLMRYL